MPAHPLPEVTPLDASRDRQGLVGDGGHRGMGLLAKRRTHRTGGARPAATPGAAPDALTHGFIVAKEIAGAQCHEEPCSGPGFIEVRIEQLADAP